MEGDGKLAPDLSARLTPAAGRRFGVVVGGVFLGFGLLARLRGHDVSPIVLWSLGGALVLGGLLVPAHLGGVYRAWMGLARVLSKVTTPIVMGVLYFILLTPMGLIRRAAGKNALVRRSKNGSFWVPREAGGRPPDHMERQF